ncbi:MAG: NYN domain-containing protein [Candidatus Veblenbacteria bacterium]|nr:NYN domain-containing protein [Candidatus Veblenbacteria bacterium]MDZ4230003.1 NYN domain-containing protein [Candidatus Veblenbacteria bacterium]
MLKHKDQRVGVFVDVANMYYSSRNLFGSRTNFGKILETAVASRKLIRAIAYVVRAEAPEEAKFFDALDKQGFEVKSKDLQVFAGGAKKGDWDVGIAIDTISMAPKLDVVVLVTGDGDFVPLVEFLQFLGQRVEVMAFSETASAKLREATDDFFDLSTERSQFLLSLPPALRRRISRNGAVSENQTQKHR